MKKKLVKTSIAIVSITSLIFFTQCKKDKNNLLQNDLNSFDESGNFANRIISGLGNIKYNSNLQMLEFTDAEQFKATMEKIENDAKNFQFDKGNTQMLLMDVM